MQSFLSALKSQRAFKALHYREFRLVTGCQMFGNLGQWMDELSRGWLIYQLTDSVVQLGLVRGIQFIPLMFFSPIAGSAADRYSRKTLLVISQAVNALLFAALAFLIFTHRIAPWHVYVTAVLAGIMQVVQHPARTSLISDTVPTEYLTNAIGLTSVIYNGARLVGPALAGALIGMADTGGAYTVQAAFLFMATVWALMLQPVAPRAGVVHRESLLRSIVKGWRYAWHNKPVRAGILCTTAASLLIFPFTTLLPVFARDLLGVGASGQGLLLGAMGVGALISAMMITISGHELERGKVMLDSSLAYGAAILIFAFTPWYWMSLVVMIVAGYCHVYANALVNTVVQSYASAEYRGRTMALFNMSQMLSTAGGLMIGLLASVLGPRVAVAAMAVGGMLAITLLIVSMPQARKIK
jgi:predicted MFS family arabinose efflux permease